MRKWGKGILKSLSASPCALCDPFQLSKIFGKESDDLIGLSIVERTGDNGMSRKEWHKRTKANPNIETRTKSYQKGHPELGSGSHGC
jgi:hypothetical protein